MGFEGGKGQYEFNLGQPFEEKIELPVTGQENVVEVLATQLENGDWSEDHGALIAGVTRVDQGQKYEIRFFENKHEPIKLDPNETLRVIRAHS
jgi:hypothetical protein